MAKKILQSYSLAAALCGLLAGCTSDSGDTAATAPLKAASQARLADVVSSRLAPVSLAGESHLLLASEKRGLVLLGADGSEVDTLGSGKVERFALQPQGDGSWLVAAFEEGSGEIQLRALGGTRAAFSLLASEPASAPLETLCFSRQDGRAHLFTIDEEGLGREYLVHRKEGAWRFSAVRPLYFGPQVTGCAADDAGGRLLVSQPPLGIWSLNASAEKDEDRTLFAAAPAEAFGGLWVDAAARQLWLAAGDSVRAYNLEQPELVFDAPLDGVEPVSAALSGGELVALEEESDTVLRFAAKLPAPAAPARSDDKIPALGARAETQPVASRGDAADDPAIWVNPDNAAASLILGTDKKSGLDVYDLSGKLLQRFPLGRLNNVDLRPVQHPQFAAIAAASNRSTPGINLFGITAVGEVQSLGMRPLALEDPYGLCMAQIDGKNYTWVSDKDGGVYQSEIQLGKSPQEWQLLDRGSVKVDSQVEGCVADDARGQLFFGEEDRGIWRLDLAAFNAGEGSPKLVAEVDGERLVDDVEGISLYAQGDAGYLVVSSQGNNSYALFSRDGSEFAGHFRVAANPDQGIDGSSETDGLDVTSAPLGAEFPQGLLVVQDGRNRMPTETQNFKLVSWADVAKKLQL